MGCERCEEKDAEITTLRQLVLVRNPDNVLMTVRLINGRYGVEIQSKRLDPEMLQAVGGTTLGALVNYLRMLEDDEIKPSSPRWKEFITQILALAADPRNNERSRVHAVDGSGHQGDEYQIDELLRD